MAASPCIVLLILRSFSGADAVWWLCTWSSFHGVNEHAWEPNVGRSTSGDGRILPASVSEPRPTGRSTSGQRGRPRPRKIDAGRQNRGALRGPAPWALRIYRTSDRRMGGCLRELDLNEATRRKVNADEPPCGWWYRSALREREKNRRDLYQSRGRENAGLLPCTRTWRHLLFRCMTVPRSICLGQRETWIPPLSPRLDKKEYWPCNHQSNFQRQEVNPSCKCSNTVKLMARSEVNFDLCRLHLSHMPRWKASIITAL